MPVVKNKTTAQSREFWSHVELVAAQVREQNRIQGATNFANEIKYLSTKTSILGAILTRENEK